MALASSSDLDLWIQEVGLFFRSPISSVGSRCLQLGLFSSKWAFRVLILALLLTLCLILASFIFAFFYFTMIPVKHLQRPVYFDFSRDAPEALVSLMGNQWEYTTPSPYNLKPVITFLTSGVPYDVDVTFTMANQVAGSQSGMLMIEATAEHSFRDKVQPVARSRRPIEIRKVPSLIQLIRDSILLMPIIFGISSTSVRVQTRIFERFVDFQQFPISTMNLTLLRSPLFSGELHLTDAVIEFTLHLSGWRYLFYTYFWTSAIVIIPAVAVLTFVIALATYFSMTTSKANLQSTSLQTADDSFADHQQSKSAYEPLPTTGVTSPATVLTTQSSPLVSREDLPVSNHPSSPSEKVKDDDFASESYESNLSENSSESQTDIATSADPKNIDGQFRIDEAFPVIDDIKSDECNQITTADDGVLSNSEHIFHDDEDELTVASSNKN